MISTLRLVSPDAREIAATFPRFVPDLQAPQAFRDMVAALNPSEEVARTEHMIASPTGAPDVRVLIYRPEGVTGPVPALLYVPGGGFIGGSPDMMNGASWRLAQRLGVIVVAVQYRLAPETPFP